MIVDRLILDAVLLIVAIGYAWFWPHCARPMLVWRHAGPWTYRLVLWVTIVAVATYVAVLLSRFASFRYAFGTPVWWATVIAFVSWVAIVGIGYLDQYRTLMRVTRAR
jgi:hypothetical protein